MKVHHFSGEGEDKNRSKFTKLSPFQVKTAFFEEGGLDFSPHLTSV